VSPSAPGWFDVPGQLQHADLARRLLADPVYAHAWICHSDGSKCGDGCDILGDPKRIEAYSCIPVEHLENPHAFGKDVPSSYSDG
jgi:hypothetical protein